MISANILEFAALAVALLGLAAVVWEIWSKDSSLFGAIASDVRAMAEPVPPTPFVGFTPASVDLSEHANSNADRKAA
jgi:hypothetical protein